MYKEITRTELVQSIGKNDLFQEGGSTLHEGIHYGDCRCQIECRRAKIKEISLAKHTRHRQLVKPIKIQKRYT